MERPADAPTCGRTFSKGCSRVPAPSPSADPPARAARPHQASPPQRGFLLLPHLSRTDITRSQRSIPSRLHTHLPRQVMANVGPRRLPGYPPSPTIPFAFSNLPIPAISPAPSPARPARPPAPKRKPRATHRPPQRRLLGGLPAGAAQWPPGAVPGAGGRGRAARRCRRRRTASPQPSPIALGRRRRPRVARARDAAATAAAATATRCGSG